MEFQFDDGGRVRAGYKGNARDCVARSIAIATGKPYREVYDALNALGAAERNSKKRKHKSSAREGVHTPTARRYLESLGWDWVPTMQIGSGCTTHLRAEELPAGRLIVKLSRRDRRGSTRYTRSVARRHAMRLRLLAAARKYAGLSG